MEMFLPFFLIIFFTTIGSIVIKMMKKAFAAPPARPAPQSGAKPAPASAPEDDHFGGSERDFRQSGFETDGDFTSGFHDEPIDPSVTYEEGIDPCHDDMEHTVSAEETAEGGMSRETANELVRAVVMSEVLNRRCRR